MAERLLALIGAIAVLAGLVWLLMMAPFGGTTLNGQPWWDQEWQHRVPITVNAAQVNVSAESFPLYIKGSNLPAAVWEDSQADCGDWRFVREDQSTVLHHEVVTCDAATQTAEVWVSAPLSAQTDTTISLYYGSSSVSNPSASFQEETWPSNYVGVYHLGRNGTVEAIDSTSNSNDGSNDGAEPASGHMQTAAEFSNNDRDGIELGNVRLSNSYTIAFWLKDYSPSDGGPSRKYITDKRPQGRTDSSQTWGAVINNRNYRWEIGGSKVRKANAVSADEWYHAGGTYSAQTNTIRGYFGGSFFDSTTGQPNRNNGVTWIGRRNRSGQEAKWFHGQIDEVWFIENVAKSEEWFTTAYNNQQADPVTSGFYSVNKPDSR